MAAPAEVLFRVHTDIRIGSVQEAIDGLVPNKVRLKLRPGQVLTLPQGDLLDQRRQRLSRLGTFLRRR